MWIEFYRKRTFFNPVIFIYQYYDILSYITTKLENFRCAVKFAPEHFSFTAEMGGEIRRVKASTIERFPQRYSRLPSTV